MKEQWTDERLDDLNHRVSDGFNRIDADLRSIRTEIGALRVETNARFDSLQRTMLQLGGGMIATFVVGFAGLLATHA
jgi:phosphosulfolactate synthase (CoM biosynthesis protein A)